ncbi:MAG: DUF262 domain-containing protein [Helicobacter sp.]|nr:DUF262 domain-containing protein [Helicobacter sp.]
MAGFQSPITINEAMQKIKNNEYLLPAFQREYVWEEWQIEELFDSLMRGYPISSMLFWEVKDKSKTSWKFYKFLSYYREKYHTHNEDFNTQGHKDFYAILDGQQRLTSLYLALYSHYDRGIRQTKWQSENNDRWFYICDFYFNLTQTQKPENPNVKYEFLWRDRRETQEDIVYIDEFKQKWFKCGEIHSLTDINKIMNFSQKYDLQDNERERLCEFHTLLFNTKDESRINFYLETEQNPDKAVNIFIRINSNGESLDYSDILFSLMVANWQKEARTEINTLIDFINQDLDFKINKDLILKGFLFLFHNSVKFQINSFEKSFVESLEAKWEGIKNAFIETFKLLQSFGLHAQTLSSNNAILPILYFIYHKNLTETIVDSVGQKDNRAIIRKWLLRTIILKPFGGSGDAVLARMRRVFIKDFKQGSEKYFDSTMDTFPLDDIEKEANYRGDMNEEFLEDIIWNSRKNSPETFAILSLLYPHLDYKNNNFHIDHLHPESAYKAYKRLNEKRGLEVWEYHYYDSLPNLQMLDANENMSKNDMSLQEWVEKQCSNDKKGFLERHLIPDVDLSLENFNDFCEARKDLLVQKLKSILC